jgi:DNA-binding SARP family transcriptional activator
MSRLTGVLRTRLLAPRVTTSWVTRDALVARVARGFAGRLVSIVAGAGYGKTTLLAQAVHRTEIPVVWCSLDERLATAQTLLGHLVTGIGERFPGFGADLSLEGAADLQAIEFCNEVLATVPDDFLLALDDVHTLGDGPASAVLEILALHLPPNVHLAMTSRARLPIPTGRLHGAGLVEIGETELALSSDEAREILHASGADVSGVEGLRTHTEGWVTGILLEARYGQAPDGHSTPAAVRDYLDHEVFAPEPIETRDLLLDAATLERFNPQLLVSMDAATRDRAGVTATLENRIFVARLEGDGDWYRFHHLFQGFLTTELAAEDRATRADRHRRASIALRDDSDPTERVPHLIAAGETLQAIEIIERLAEPMLASPEAETLGEWLDAIPREVWADRPAIVLTAASLRFNRAEFESAFNDLEDAVDLLLPSGDHERAALAVIRLLQALGAAGGGRQTRGIDFAERYLARLDPSARMVPPARLMLASMLGYACRYEEAAAEIAAAEASPAARLLPIFATYAAVTRAFFVDRPLGRITEAATALDRAIEDLTAREAQDVLAYLPYAHTYRSVVLSEAGRYDEALAESSRVQEVADQRGIGRVAVGVVAWLRFAALAGLGRWDELAIELDASAISFTRFGAGGRSYLRHASLARLAAHRGEASGVRAEIEAALPGLRAQGYAFEVAIRLADLSAAARSVGLGPLAHDLAAEARTAAADARAPWAETRAAIAAAAASDGEERDAHLTDALAASERFDAAAIWGQRERALAAELLPRAVAAGLGPTTLAARLAAACGGEILEACIIAAHADDADVREVLADLAGAAPGMDAPSVASLLEDPSPSVRAAARRSASRIEARSRPSLAVQTFGGFSVHRDGVPMSENAFGRQKARVLFAALCCARGAVHREALLEWLWPDLAPERGLRALQTTIYELRKALEPGAEKGAPSLIMSEGETYLLALDAHDSVDVIEFGRLLSAVDKASDPAARRQLLVRADEVAAGDFLPEWPYAPWAEERRRAVEELQRDLLAQLAQVLAESGRHDAAAARYRRLLAMEPEREAWHRSLMQIYSDGGERAMALRQYQACRARLRQELGIEPGAATHDLYMQILKQGPRG